uniref:non-specific serine/threonine protein kinase n=1 Tax=Rhizophora mucronata TaxID=61149 RepID=A0A2P2JDH2_RHIMU
MYNLTYIYAGASRNGSKQINGSPSATSSSGMAEDGKVPKKHSIGGNQETNDKETAVPVPGGRIITPNLKVFSLAELKSATRNFRPDTMLGEGGFGRVFKGWIDEKTYAPSKAGVGIAVAVKKSNLDSLQGWEEWQAEVRFLGKFSHPNLVKLLGYCMDDRQFLLVYEHVPKGSLDNYLFRRHVEPLPWNTRLKIAIGAAQGLAFLHTSENSVIYRDFKSSNILLEGDYNPKLSDFGLAKLGPENGRSHVSTQPMGTYGYAAPEYVATGHLYVRSDVYGFGVVLLEMLTGLIALDPHRPTNQLNLVQWARPSLSDKKKLKKIMDPRLDGQYPLTAATQVAQLILHCLEYDPKSRPHMDEVLDTLEQIAKAKENPSEVKANAKNRTNQRQHHSAHSPYSSHHQSPIHPKHIRSRNGAPAHVA